MKTFEEEMEEITQQMLLDYTAWASGEPVAWDVKKREARAAILAAHQAEMDRVVEEVIGESDHELNAKEFVNSDQHSMHKDIVVSYKNQLRNDQRARYKDIKEKQ